MTSSTKAAAELSEEAAAFNQRISERRASGFVPDIRRAARCDYFYKSFWRDPHYVQLYLGRMVETYLDLLEKYARPGGRILDAGCGAGYFALELARAGYHVVGIDVAEKAIAVARETLADNPFTDGFGSLCYEVCPLLEATGRYDVVFFSGVLHHLADVNAATSHIRSLLNDDGVVIGCEPCHEKWQRADAAQVALMRGLLHLTGHWYQPLEDDDAVRDVEALDRWVDEIHTEYVTERDKGEPGGQSPNDNSADGDEILAALDEQFEVVETRPASAFIYRLLGGLRGEDALTHRVADFLATYERYAVAEGFTRPNGFYFAARKR